MNIVAIMGRLTADPELRTTSNGTSVTSFTVAVDRDYAPQGKERETDFLNVVAWRGTADFINRFFRKGKMIAIVGSLQTRSYEDKNGNKRTVTEIIADKATFCGDKANDTAEAEKPDLSVNFADAETDDGLPF
jgi:single-strand DNA-binding protein